MSIVLKMEKSDYTGGKEEMGVNKHAWEEVRDFWVAVGLQMHSLAPIVSQLATEEYIKAWARKQLKAIDTVEGCLDTRNTLKDVDALKLYHDLVKQFPAETKGRNELRTELTQRRKYFERILDVG